MRQERGAWRRAKRRALSSGQTLYRGRALTKQMVLKIDAQDATQTSSGKLFESKFGPRGQTRGKKPGQQARAPRLVWFNWNAGGLTGDSYDMLLVFLFENKVSAATIQETHWRFSSEWSTEFYHCIHSGGGRGSAGGCLTMIAETVCGERLIRFQDVLPGRLLYVRCDGSVIF